MCWEYNIKESCLRRVRGAHVCTLPVSAMCVFLFQNLGGYNPVLRPRVVGRWVGREDEDADPLAAEMLQPPVPRARMEVCWRGDNSPAGRSVLRHTQNHVMCHKRARVLIMKDR